MQEMSIISMRSLFKLFYFDTLILMQMLLMDLLCGKYIFLYQTLSSYDILCIFINLFGNNVKTLSVCICSLHVRVNMCMYE